MTPEEIKQAEELIADNSPEAMTTPAKAVFPDKPEHREAEALLDRFERACCDAHRREDRAKIVALVSRGLEGEKAALSADVAQVSSVDAGRGPRSTDAQNRAIGSNREVAALDKRSSAESAAAQPTSGTTAKSQHHAYESEVMKTESSETMQNMRGKQTEVSATGAVIKESSVTATAKCPKCGQGIFELHHYGVCDKVYCLTCSNWYEIISVADFAQFFPVATDRLPDAEELANVLWKSRPMTREVSLELARAALAALSGERK